MPVHTMESDDRPTKMVRLSVSSTSPLLLIFFAPNYALPAVPPMQPAGDANFWRLIADVTAEISSVRPHTTLSLIG